MTSPHPARLHVDYRHQGKATPRVEATSKPGAESCSPSRGISRPKQPYLSAIPNWPLPKAEGTGGFRSPGFQPGFDPGKPSSKTVCPESRKGESSCGPIRTYRFRKKGDQEELAPISSAASTNTRACRSWSFVNWTFASQPPPKPIQPNAKRDTPGRCEVTISGNDISDY
jgi:hypothetical protein